MRLSIESVLDYGFPLPADVLLQIEVAATPDQFLEAQSLVIESDHPIRAVAGEEGIGQRCWARGEGRLVARYTATVTIDRAVVRLDELPATPAARLPAATIPYLLPSRYCEADRFDHFVRRTFGGLSGGALAVALADWVRTNLEYAPAPLGGGALHTFAERRGVCRDYAHLLVALARAAGIPARCVSVYAPGVDPPDFHAVAEVWLDGAWHLLDATGMARADEMARVGVGRDATDIAFMTIFGAATLWEQRVAVRRLEQERPPRSGVDV
ncbi:transglutaminase-like putative cysteine protease [Sphingomonas sp. BE138]|uniref:transglutaminase-like domain-containing protein n=1 Tax=Sphingomonas sp. BE138 TaxID=2817845 RepID=UPI002860BC24|nr:transglutaminase family protein [Sphingomonas sp. BE138]MDR6789329.1 transglutaminase-like putative cysteine protease [Sphingomonas sp. BE138]